MDDYDVDHGFEMNHGYDVWKTPHPWREMLTMGVAVVVLVALAAWFMTVVARVLWSFIQ